MAKKRKVNDYKSNDYFNVSVYCGNKILSLLIRGAIDAVTVFSPSFRTFRRFPDISSGDRGFEEKNGNAITLLILKPIIAVLHPRRRKI